VFEEEGGMRRRPQLARARPRVVATYVNGACRFGDCPARAADDAAPQQRQQT
jgi:hypothetical protein